MPKRIVLLTGKVEAPHLTGMLQKRNPQLLVDWISDRESLEQAIADGTRGTRLVSILTEVIVPADALAALPGPAYNFHPGPPTYPGSQAASFAVYEGATDYGVTLHEMAAKVDSGPIVEVRRFLIDDNAKFADVEIKAFTVLIEMFRDYAEHLACHDDPLPLSANETWTGRTRTNAEAAKLKTIEADMTEEEIVRRYRAFG